MPKASKNQRTHKQDKHPCYGPCADCGATDSRGKGDHKEAETVPHFNAVKRISSSGKSRFVRLCDKCVPKP